MTSPESAARTLAEASADSVLATDAMSRGMGMRLTDVDRDRAVVEMLVREDMLNGLGVCHGGIVFSLADTVCAVVSNSRNKKAVLQSATVTLVGPVYEGDMLTATGHRSAGEGRVALQGSHHLVREEPHVHLRLLVRHAAEGELGDQVVEAGQLL